MDPFVNEHQGHWKMSVRMSLSENKGPRERLGCQCSEDCGNWGCVCAGFEDEGHSRALSTSSAGLSPAWGVVLWVFGLLGADEGWLSS